MAPKIVVAVLRSGGEFALAHVQALQRQFKRWAPDARFICLSDVPIPGVETIPLKYDWPGWWCKMEIFRPELPLDDFLLTDLDNVVLGPLDDILAVDKYTTQKGESNALAFMTKEVRELVWREWVQAPERHMYNFDPVRSVIKHSFGDGGFVASLIHAQQHWEEMFPGQVTNIATLQVNCPWPFRPFDIPKTTRILLCHRPHRPWLLPFLRKFNLYGENL